MPKFATENISLINAREVVEQLIKDGIKVLDQFREDLNDTTYLSEFNTMIKYIEHAADGNSLPVTKMRKYSGSKDGTTEYEFKSKHLRLWAIQQPNKKIIIFCGFKNSQPKDEKSFWALKKQYLKSLEE